MIFTIAKATDAPDRWDTAQIVVQSLISRERRTLVNGGSDARYVSTGHLLYAVRGIVFAVPFDPVRQQPLGRAVAVINGVRRPPLFESGAAHFDISATGTLLYVPGPVDGSRTERAIVFADRDGRLTPLPTPARPYVHVRASRDGARFVLDSDDGKEAIVWIYELAGTSAPRRLTFGGRNRFPVWSSDGQRVAFQSDRERDLAIFEQRIDGSGLRRLTTPEKGAEHVPESWSPDGKHLSFSVMKDSTYAMWMLSFDDNTAAFFGNVQSSEPIGSIFSPNGRWIAYHSLPPGIERELATSSGVFVQPFPAGAIRQASRVGRDFQPVWSQKGDELFYVATALPSGSGRFTAVRVGTQSGLEFGNPQILPVTIVGGRTSTLTRAFDVMPDGRFVGLWSGSAEELTTGGASSSEVRVVLNWFEELKRLVPTK
jgi:WD40-like Beta Propeller Repeat